MNNWLKKYPIATTPQQQNQGLNNSLYDTMYFPSQDNGGRVFRGLDNNTPVGIKDSTGKTKVLSGPQDQAVFYGGVSEKRMQQGGKNKQLPPIYTNDPKDPRLQAYNDSLYANNVSNQLSKLVKPDGIGQNIDATGIHSQYGIEQFLKEHNIPNRVGYDANYKGIQPVMKNVSSDEYLLSYPQFKKPIQPIIIDKSIQQLPISQPNQLPIEVSQPSQTQSMYPDKPNYSDGVMDDYHKVTGLYKNGGWLTKYQQGGKVAQEANPYQKNIDYLNSITPDQMQMNELRNRQNNTPAIGAPVSWQDKFRNSGDFTHYLPSGALQEVGRAANFVGYPANAAVNLTQPVRYFEGKSNKAEGVSDMFLDMMAASSLAHGVSNFEHLKPVYGESNIAPHYPHSSIESIPRMPVQTSDNFPAGSIGKAKTPTSEAFITQIPELSKQQQILQSYGLDPYKERLSDEDFFKQTDQHLQNIFDKEKQRQNVPSFITPNPLGKGEAFEQNYSQELFPGISTSPNENLTMPKGKQTYNPDFFPYESDSKLRHYNIQDKLMKQSSNFPQQYTDFGQKTAQQRMMNEGRSDQFPESLKPKVRQQNKLGGKINKQNNWLNKY